jgi:Na+-transporting NADH:ubiquinone oxidoreductase subunit A
VVHIKVTKGLDIPIKGKPKGSVKPLIPSGEASPLMSPTQIALDLTPFEDVKFRLLVRPGDVVKIGQSLAEDKSSPGRFFVSPASGTIKEIQRGEKRVLQNIVIHVDQKEEAIEHPPLMVEHLSREEIVERLKTGGLFAHIRSRPFNLLADPEKKPRSIFVKAIESAPFMPPAELQVVGHEKAFQVGLNALTKLTDGPVHLVYSTQSTSKAFLEASGVHKHTAEGPHPVGTHSLHIHLLDPILASSDLVWTVNAHDVIGIGYILMTGRYFTERLISIAGPGVIPERVGYFKARMGYPIAGLVSGRIQRGRSRLISGDPLMGHQVTAEGFLGFHDYVFCVFPEPTSRQFLHFFRLGINRYTFSKAYVSGHLNNQDREYDFTTNLNGEHRFFIDSSLYQKVTPLKIPVMHLVKAVMAEDFDLAEELGLLEVDSEDFALPAFVCPSKMEMPQIIKKGLKQYAHEVLQ